jgi:hypothetical protein
MKIIVAGSRDFNDFELLEKSLIDIIKEFGLTKKSQITIVSGTANGADKLGEKFARKYGINIDQFPADWNKYGKRAGYLRNVQMAEHSDVLVAFWDGKSRGTSHMINIANDKKLKSFVIKY